MVDIPIKPAGVRSPVPVPPDEIRKKEKELEAKPAASRPSDSFRRIRIPELLKALKEAIVQRGSQALPASVAQGKPADADSLEAKMVERFGEGKAFGAPVNPGTQVFAEKSEDQCYQMLERRLAPYTEERRVPPQNILKAVHRGLYRKSGTKEQLFLFADVVIQKGEKTKTEKMTRIPLEGEAKAKALSAAPTPGGEIDPSLLTSLKEGNDLVYLALSHKVIHPELVKDSEIAVAELARVKADRPEMVDRGRLSFSSRVEGMARAHVQQPKPTPAATSRPQEASRWQIRAVWLLLGATLILSLLYWFHG